MSLDCRFGETEAALAAVETDEGNAWEKDAASPTLPSTTTHFRLVESIVESIVRASRIGVSGGAESRRESSSSSSSSLTDKTIDGSGIGSGSGSGIGSFGVDEGVEDDAGGVFLAVEEDETPAA